MRTNSLIIVSFSVLAAAVLCLVSVVDLEADDDCTTVACYEYYTAYKIVSGEKRCYGFSTGGTNGNNCEVCTDTWNAASDLGGTPGAAYGTCKKRRFPDGCGDCSTNQSHSDGNWYDASSLSGTYDLETSGYDRCNCTVE